MASALPAVSVACCSHSAAISHLPLMAGALGAVRDVFASRIWSINIPFGIFQRSSSTSVSDLRSGSLEAAHARLERQRAFSFSLGFCFCGNDYEDRRIPVKPDQLFLRGGQRNEYLNEGNSWHWRWLQGIWQLFGRRRSNDTGAENLDNDDRVFYRPSKWKLLLRRLRGEISKMNCAQQSPGFHYDALSYAKNFDDGCWQQCDSHARGRFSQDMFPASLSVENGSLQTQLTGETCHVDRRTSIVLSL